MKNQPTQARNKPKDELDNYDFEVDCTIESDLIVKIRRFLPPAPAPKSTPGKKPEVDNPYTITKKSYRSSETPRHNRTPPTVSHPPELRRKKKTPKDTETIPLPNHKHHRQKIHNPPLSITLPHPTSYFQPSFFTSFVQTTLDTESSPPHSPILPTEKRLNTSCNNLEINQNVVSTIQIVTNENEKVNVSIHKALLQANTTSKPTENNFFDGVPNPFNLELRDRAMKKINFVKDYKNGYAPIDLQNKNEVDTIKEQRIGYFSVTDSARTHFIRKKQSTLSLPRTCGVSYIKPSQSSQGPPFFPLPPLIFQCSSECDEEISVTPELQELTRRWIECLETCWLLVVECDEQDMRELLLGKALGKIRLVKGIQNLWLLITDKAFLAVAIVKPCTDESKIWGEFHAADVKLGILGKKSTSGKKLFFKSVGLDMVEKQSPPHLQNQQSSTCEGKEDHGELHESAKELGGDQGVNPKTIEDNSVKDCAVYLRDTAKNKSVITLSIRLEMYVGIEQWKRYSKETKNLLNYLTLQIKQRLESKSLDIIQKRLAMVKNGDVQAVIEKELRNYKILTNPCPPSKQTEKQLNFFDKSVLNQILLTNLRCRQEYQAYLSSRTKQMPLPEFLDGRSISALEKSMHLKIPLYYISTRDSFAFDLVEKTDIIISGDRKYIRTQYFFDRGNVPANFSSEFRKLFPNFDVGIITYNNFFTEEEMKNFEEKTFETEVKALKNNFLQMTVQPTIAGSKIKRTKFFFGYRYMWTRGQLAEPNSYVGAGVRKDVTPPPSWVKDMENILVDHKLVEKNFINSVAINVYHDGKEGLAQHFDDAVRFKQPIFTIRLFSDARLSFGSQLYGFCNSAFVIPLPRGCICVMTQHSYAANGVKHCVRPVDMAGKSAAVILRQMHSGVTTEVDKYDQQIDFPMWVSTLSAKENCVTYAEQKKRESDYLMEKKDTKSRGQQGQQEERTENPVSAEVTGEQGMVSRQYEEMYEAPKLVVGIQQ